MTTTVLIDGTTVYVEGKTTFQKFERKEGEPLSMFFDRVLEFSGRVGRIVTDPDDVRSRFQMMKAIQRTLPDGKVVLTDDNSYIADLVNDILG